MLLSQVRVHYAFINDPVDLVSTGYEMEHFKHGEYWVAWNDLKCVVRRLLLFPMRPAVPYTCNAQNSHEPMCERGRQSRCGSTPLSFKIRTWLDMNMIWQEKKAMLYYDVICTCLMHANQVDLLFQNWQSDRCHSIAWSEGVENVLSSSFSYIFSIIIVIFLILLCFLVLLGSTLIRLQNWNFYWDNTTLTKWFDTSIDPKLALWLWIPLALSCCDRHPRLKPYRSSCDSLATSTKDAAAGTHGIGQWCGRCQSDHCVKGIWGEHLLPATFRALAGVCAISNIMEWNQLSSELANIQRCLEVGWNAACYWNGFWQTDCIG